MATAYLRSVGIDDDERGTRGGVFESECGPVLLCLGLEMSSPGVSAIAPGDVAVATGHLYAENRVVRLSAVGRGHYDYVLQQAAGVAVATDLAPDSIVEGTVTVRGIWSGIALTDAQVLDPMSPVGVPEHIGERVDSSILPPERRSKESVLDPSLMTAIDEVRGRSLLSYVAHRTPEGWFGVASATDRHPVEAILRPRLGDAFTVTETTWTADDLDRISALWEQNVFDDELLDFGQFVDPMGRLTASALVRIVSPAMAQVVETVHPRALVLTSWLQPA